MHSPFKKRETFSNSLQLSRFKKKNNINRHTLHFTTLEALGRIYHNLKLKTSKQHLRCLFLDLIENYSIQFQHSRKHPTRSKYDSYIFAESRSDILHLMRGHLKKLCSLKSLFFLSFNFFGNPKRFYLTQLKPTHNYNNNNQI